MKHPLGGKIYNRFLDCVRICRTNQDYCCTEANWNWPIFGPASGFPQICAAALPLLLQDALSWLVGIPSQREDWPASPPVLFDWQQSIRGGEACRWQKPTRG